MTRSFKTAALAALLAAATVPALAADAYTTANVNLRAGPGTDYPRLGVVSAGTRVDVQGCIANWRWCDVRVQGDRGWVAGSALSMMRGSNRVYLRDEAPTVGLPILSFIFDDYWNDNYRARTFYRDRDRYRNHWRARDRDRDWDRGWDRDRYPRPGVIDNRRPAAPPAVAPPPPAVVPPVIVVPPPVINPPVPFVDQRDRPPTGPSSQPITPDGKIDNRRPGTSR